MAFVIYCIKKQKFVKHPNLWSATLKEAAKFNTMEKLQNYMANNFAGNFPDVSTDGLQFLSTDNLSQNYSPFVTLSDEEARVKFEWLKETIAAVLAESEKLVALPRHYGKQLAQLELETQDILHRIEFTNENVINGFYRYKQLQDVRQRRRKVKDNLEYATLLLTSGFLESVSSLQMNIDKMDKDMAERKYTPRVLNELFDDDNPDD